MRFRFDLIWLFFISALPLFAVERILLFDVDIQVRSDASILVKEEILVESEMHQIRHGIVREFPTTYNDVGGTRYVVDFIVKEVLLDESPIEYTIKQQANGQYIYIGKKNTYLKRGQHNFTLVYETRRQLGFFKEHDELYWNVTGNGWRLPIDKVKARVSLPQGIDIGQIKFDAYTGFYGQKNYDVEGFVARNGTVQFASTRHFRPQEGLTIVVGWPKGYIVYPSFVQQVVWFFDDNRAIFILLFGLLILLVQLYRIWRKKDRLQHEKPIIPLFYPPKDMTPGMVQYILHHGYGNMAFAAEVVNMAVHNWLSINYVPGYMYGGTYHLIKKTSPSDTYPMYQKIYNQLFKKHDKLVLDAENALTIQACQNILHKKYTPCSSLFDLHIHQLVQSGIVAAICLFAVLLLDSLVNFYVGIGVYALVLFVTYYFFKSYTKKGYDIWRDIQGFKLFLSITEQERMKIIGTPPTKTPELYEKYLPYAMALGVEDQWSRQFAPVFERLKQEGNPYKPIWYIGLRPYSLSSGGFSSSFSRSVSSAISSAVKAPGKSSGFGGRSGGGGGFSGGGGGGGGGGGW